MSLKIASNNTPAYAYYSEGTGATPITVSVTLDGTGAPTTITGATTNPTYLVGVDSSGTIGSYSGITIAPINEEVGINWEISADNITFGESISPTDMDVSATDQVVQIYLQAVVANDGSVETNNYVLPDIQITATENPDA